MTIKERIAKFFLAIFCFVIGFYDVGFYLDLDWLTFPIVAWIYSFCGVFAVIIIIVYGGILMAEVLSFEVDEV